MLAQRRIKEVFAIRSADIVEIAELRNGEQLTQQEITERIGRPAIEVRDDICWLVLNRRLCRICGLGSAPAKYFLPPREAR